jgi:hypothetical protein
MLPSPLFQAAKKRSLPVKDHKAERATGSFERTFCQNRYGIHREMASKALSYEKNKERTVLTLFVSNQIVETNLEDTQRTGL